MALPDISVIVPAFNEAENIAPLIEEISTILNRKVSYELIYVDDCSSDATLSELQCLQKYYPSLRVLHHATRCGQSAAIVTGVCAAKAPWVVTLDADGQNDPADIPLLLQQLDSTGHNSKTGLVTGVRTSRQDNWLKLFSSRVANSLRRRVLQDETPDTGCGLKLFSRDTFMAVPHFDHMHRFLPALFKRQGKGIRIIPVSHRPRRHGVSKYGVNNRLWVGIIDMLGVAWLQSRNNSPASVREFTAHSSDNTLTSHQ